MRTGWVRRALVVPALACAVLVTSPSAASAAFTARAAAPLTVGTATVAPATAPTTAGSTACVLSLTTSYTVRISWTASTTARVTGYVVTETVNGVARAPVTLAGTSAQRAATKPALQTATHAFSIVARTDYGWTAVPATVTFRC